MSTFYQSGIAFNTAPVLCEHLADQTCYRYLGHSTRRKGPHILPILCSVSVSFCVDSGYWRVTIPASIFIIHFLPFLALMQPRSASMAESPEAYPRFENWADPRLSPMPSRIQGMGLVAKKKIAQGEVVVRWGGELMPQEDYDPSRYRPKSWARYDATRVFATRISEPVTIIEYINHSCDPNTWMADSVTKIARRDIAAGEEITTDFALWSDDDYAYTSTCLCGTSLCRSLVTGKDWQRVDLQERYNGFFLPFINKLIVGQRGGGSS